MGKDRSMEKEILACIDENNIKFLQSGQISKYVFPMEREKAHKNKIAHLITRFFIFTVSPKGNIKYLVQKRGKNKNSFPNYFTDSASGHVNWERNLNLFKIKKNALRELKEEFGIPYKAVKRIQFYELNYEENNNDKEVAYIFIGMIDYNTSLNPDPFELDIESSKFYDKAELGNLLKNENSIDYSKKMWERFLNSDIQTFFGSGVGGAKAKDDQIALFIGRFQPLHHGHVYVLRNILKSYNKIKIGIGSSQASNTFNDPFTDVERKKFLNAVFRKRHISSKVYTIYNIPDIYNAKKWVDHVTSIVGEFNAIFSNNDWIRELFYNKGYKIERKITIFEKKFNGTNIRLLITKNDTSWRNLVPNEVIGLINEFDGINRIKTLFNQTDNL
jgi:nicotinamide-nucleotide adenylyltransferase